MSPTASFERVWETLRCYIYNIRMNIYQTSILLHPKFRLARLLNSFQYGCQFNVMELPKRQKTPKKARNHEFFRAREFSWNQGTLINNHLQDEKEKSRREKSSVFLLETPKNYTLNKKFNLQMTTVRVFPKIRALFFHISEKGHGRSPLPRLVTHLENMVLITIKLCLL